MESPSRDLTLPIVVGLLVLVLGFGAWQHLRDPDPEAAVGPGAGTTLGPVPGAPLPTVGPSTAPNASPGTNPALPPTGHLSCAPAIRSQPLRVLTFNIHRGHRNGRPDLARIATEINSLEADVVLLQEVDRFGRWTPKVDQAAWLGQKLGMGAVHGVNVSAPGKSWGYGTAILSKHPILEWNNALLPRAAGTEQRGLLRAVVEVGGKPVSFYGTHLDHTSGAGRVAQMRQIRAWMRADPNPHVLGGDLNAKPGSGPWRVATSYLQDAWSAGEGEGLTVPARKPRARIDYLLHSPQIFASRAATFRSAISDHRAVWADLQVPLVPQDCTLIEP